MICPECWHELDQHGPKGCEVYRKVRTTGKPSFVVREYCECSRPRLILLGGNNDEMGLMDDLYKDTSPAGAGGGYLKADDKDLMVQVKQPFNVRGVVFRKNSKYTDQKTGEPRQEWVLHLRFLDTSGQVTEVDNGEGELAPIDRSLTLTNSDLRSQVMPKLKALVDQALAAGQDDGVGPFYLFKQRVQGQANPAYMIGDWDGAGNAAPASAAPAPPPPPAEILSADGKWRWNGTAWEANSPPPPPPPDVIPVTGAPSVPFSKGAEPGLPEPGKSQPMPSTITKVSGGDGEGGGVVVEHVKGDEIRQAIYRGDGVIQTPSGGLVQAVAPEPAAIPPASGPMILSPDGKHFLGGDGKWHPVPPPPGEQPEIPVMPELQTAEQARVEARGIGQEAPEEAPGPPPPPPPPPAPEGVPAAVGATQGKRKSIPMSAKCDTCGKTVKGMAFKNSKDRFIITHTCTAIDPTTTRPFGSKTLDVDEAVRSIIQEAIS